MNARRSAGRIGPLGTPARPAGQIVRQRCPWFPVFALLSEGPSKGRRGPAGTKVRGVGWEVEGAGRPGRQARHARQAVQPESRRDNSPFPPSAPLPRSPLLAGGSEKGGAAGREGRGGGQAAQGRIYGVRRKWANMLQARRALADTIGLHVQSARWPRLTGHALPPGPEPGGVNEFRPQRRNGPWLRAGHATQALGDTQTLR